MQRAQKVLILRFSSFGDVAIMIPVLRALTKSYPEVEFVVASRPKMSPIFDEFENINFLSIDIENEYAGFTGILKLFKKLKKIRPTHIADLHFVIRTRFINLCFKLTGYKVKSIDKGRRQKKALIRIKNKHFEPLTPTVFRYSKVFSNLGFPIDITKNEKLYNNSIPKNLKEKSFILSAKEFERVSKLRTPNKLILIIKKPQNILFDPKERFLILENIQDPGNFGTIIRTADWFGIHQIVCSLDSADVFNSKTLQASMGSFLRIQVYYKELIPFLNKSNYNVAGALLDGAPLEENSLINSHAIMLGNEGQGISNKMEKFCTNPVKIIGYGGAESLNVSIAASILMYEWTKKSKS